MQQRITTLGDRDKESDNIYETKLSIKTGTQINSLFLHQQINYISSQFIQPGDLNHSFKYLLSLLITQTKLAIRVSVEDSNRLTLNEAFRWSVTVSHEVSRLTTELSANGHNK